MLATDDERRTLEPADATPAEDTEKEMVPLMNIQILKSSPVPLYFQIAEAIRADVRRNNIPAGSKLMTEGQLARELKVATGTVRQAMQLLAENHVVVRVQGSGTYVA